MTALGSITNGSSVFSDGKSVNFLTMFAKANLASSRANLIPTHPLGPCPKGRNAYLENYTKIKVFKKFVKSKGDLH